MKKVLFTIRYFKNFAGSELVTLSQVEYFQKKGWHIDVFTLEYGNPLKDTVNDANVFTLENKGQLLDEYDLIISRQYPLLDYVLFTLKIKAKRVYYECVSYRIPVDAYPIYYKNLTMIGAISERVKNDLKNFGFDTSNTFRMPNYASKEYFDIEHNCNKKIKSIAIVSNHVPEELEKFKTYTEDNSDIKVDIYGMHHTYKLVTPKLLNDYDVIISVGKTIFYSLAMGIPSYTYDEVCTEGYIYIDNYKKNLDNNMAYNLEYNKKTGKEIYKEVIEQYNNVCSQTKRLKEFARRDFYFDDLMDELINTIMSREEIDYEKLYNEYPTLGYTARTYVEDLAFSRKEIMRWYSKSIELGNLYQDEIKKTVSALENYDAIVNSNGWKMLERLRKLKKWIR